MVYNADQVDTRMVDGETGHACCSASPHRTVMARGSVIRFAALGAPSTPSSGEQLAGRTDRCRQCMRPSRLPSRPMP